MLQKWLPTSAKEVKELGWESIDVILFSGDAYIDHPSFGAAVIGRVLESEGLKVAIVPQPNWRDDLRDFKKLGKPNLFFAVSAGSMDSMVNHYTANKRLRSNDAYTPEGRAGQRPDYATITYCTILKKLFPDVPIVIGGIEASLRRVTHYDYWSDMLKPSILVDSKADLLIYGMGEKSIRAVVAELRNGKALKAIDNVPQTAFLRDSITEGGTTSSWEITHLSSHEKCLNDKKAFAQNFKVIEEESNRWNGAQIIQQIGKKTLCINPAYPPMSTTELDSIYELPFTRLPHPRYKGKTIPAYEMIRHSINIHRGCFGGCAFCTISAHQGKFIVSRSPNSIKKEIDSVVAMPDFKGYISDLGGPSANMYLMGGKDISICQSCKRPSCIFPGVCKNLETSHAPLLQLLRGVENNHEVKKAFIGSGIRYDIIFHETGNSKTDEVNKAYLQQVIAKHVSGRLKVAPEHTSDTVLKLMRKPSFSYFKKLIKFFSEANKKAGLNQQLIPYFISSHPGSTPRDMALLMVETRKLDFKLEQVQDFTPTPMTLATVIYYSGIHPYTLETVFTARTQNEKLAQRKYFFWYKSEYRKTIEQELRKMGFQGF